MQMHNFCFTQNRPCSVYLLYEDLTAKCWTFSSTWGYISAASIRGSFQPWTWTAQSNVIQTAIIPTNYYQFTKSGQVLDLNICLMLYIICSTNQTRTRFYLRGVRTIIASLPKNACCFKQPAVEFLGLLSLAMIRPTPPPKPPQSIAYSLLLYCMINDLGGYITHSSITIIIIIIITMIRGNICLEQI